MNQQNKSEHLFPETRVFKGVELGKGVFNISASSPLPPKENFDIANPDEYKNQFTTNPVIPWGKNNLFPTELDAVASQVPVVESGLKILSDHLAGQGLYLYIEKFEKGKRIIEEVDNEILLEAMYNANFYEYWDTGCRELPRWGNVFPVHKLTNERKYSQIRVYDTPWNRLERHDPTDAEIKNIYVSSQWWRGIDSLINKGEITDDLKKWIFKIRLLNDFDPAVQMFGDKNTFSFAQHIKYHTSGHDYGRSPWHACFRNGWLGISKGVPAMLKKLFENVMTINYHVEVDSEYWKTRVGNEWEDEQIWTPEKKAEHIADWQKEIERKLVGEANIGKSVFSTLIRVNGTEQISAIKITVVENKLLTAGENFIPNSQQADGQITGAIGLDPSMIGLVVPGGKQSAGSGSNIREASLALNARLRPDRERLLEPFYTMRDYMLLQNPSLAKDPNFKKIKIGVRDYIINTLDERAPASGKEVTAS